MMKAFRFVARNICLIHLVVLLAAPKTSTAFSLSPGTSWSLTSHAVSRSSSSSCLRATRPQQPQANESTGFEQRHRDPQFEALLNNLRTDHGIPILGCDASSAHTMLAALWNTLADVSQADQPTSACLVLENIPPSALQAFVNDVMMMQATEDRLMEHLPELTRIEVSLVSPSQSAVLIQSTARTAAEMDQKYLRPPVQYNEAKCTGALKTFIERIVVGEQVCPYTKSVDVAAVGLHKQGIEPGPVGYRLGCADAPGNDDVCAAMAAFWDCVCELMETPESEISTIMLSLPGLGPGATTQAHDRFAAVTELMSRQLVLFRGDALFGLVFFHPAYDRARIVPTDKPAYGHLPPRTWLRPMLRHNGNAAEAATMTEDDLELSDYQRRSPFTAINILRANQLDAAGVGAKAIVDLEIEDGIFEKASGITTYSRNAIRLAAVGREKLAADVEDDMKLVL